MEGFLTFIITAILVIYLVGWLGRILLRAWIIRKQKEFAQNGGQGTYYKQYTWGTGQRKRETREGEVTVEQTQRTEKRVSGSVGEYVEYEEISETTEEMK